MNNKKVYIEGRVVGSFAGTLGSKGKKIHLISGDIVDVDDSFIIESIEPEKVRIPQFVAEYIEYAENTDWDLQDLFKLIDEEDSKELQRWFYHECNQEMLAKAWIFGYEVEKEKRYLVSLKNGQPLVKAPLGGNFYFDQNITTGNYKATRKELEDAGFGWVFDCEGVEIEEVE